MQQQDDRLDGYAVKSCTVGDLSDADRARCLALIAEGHAVNARAAARDFPRSLRVAVARNHDQIVGTGSIKPVRTEYAESTACGAEYAFDPSTPELGYVAVDPAHRGKRLSSRLAEDLAQYPGPLFARTSDLKMKSALKGAGFVRRGVEWKGIRGDLISLWIRT